MTVMEGASARAARFASLGATLGVIMTLWLGVAVRGVAAQQDHRSTFEKIGGEVVLDNPRVEVEKFVLRPGESTGLQRHPFDQLWVFVKGGVLTSGDGRAVLWRDGRVLWRRASGSPEDGSANTGTAPMTIICVNLKPWRSKTSPGKPQWRHLDYPNIPGEDLLENDLVIVQRFIVNPGQWEGVHAHHPDMLYVHIKGGEWAAKSYQEPEHPYPTPAADGDVGWMPTIDLSVGHQSGNIGKEPIDLVWVTLKK